MKEKAFDLFTFEKDQPRFIFFFQNGYTLVSLRLKNVKKKGVDSLVYVSHNAKSAWSFRTCVSTNVLMSETNASL